MIETSKDGNTVYYKDRTLALYLGLLALFIGGLVMLRLGWCTVFTVVVIIQVVLVVYFAVLPKKVCIIGTDHISWNNHKLLFQDISFFCITRKSLGLDFFVAYTTTHGEGIHSVLTFVLRTNQQIYDLDGFLDLSSKEQQHLLRLLRKSGVKQKK